MQFALGGRPDCEQVNCQAQPFRAHWRPRPIFTHAPPAHPPRGRRRRGRPAWWLKGWEANALLQQSMRTRAQRGGASRAIQAADARQARARHRLQGLLYASLAGSQLTMTPAGEAGGAGRGGRPLSCNSSASCLVTAGRTLPKPQMQVDPTCATHRRPSRAPDKAGRGAGGHRQSKSVVWQAALQGEAGRWLQAQRPSVAGWLKLAQAACSAPPVNRHAHLGSLAALHTGGSGAVGRPVHIT